MNLNRKKSITIVMFLIILSIIVLFVTFCSRKEEVTKSSYSDAEGVNKPALVNGMKAVKWDGNEWVEVNEPDKNTSWYDYKKKDNNEWANAKTADGSMWVWIPRYAYKIVDNKVEIIFLKNTDKKNYSDYIIHPSFTDKVNDGGWDSNISGFWISKFEAGKESDKLVFLPNKYSYNNITISDSYDMCKNSGYNESYPHLIKSSEWGAVAYLAVSQYGRDGVEVSSNNTKVILSDINSTSVTAGGNGIDGLATSEKEALINNANQSTTGNIYGVYDMAGGMWERVAAYINNSNDNLKNGKSLLEDGSANESNKYKTVYAYNKNTDKNEDNYNTNKNVKGDAIFETSNGIGNGEQSWFGDYSSFMTGNSPFLHRGGSTNNTTGVGIFAFSNTPGQSAVVLGFRCSIVME